MLDIKSLFNESYYLAKNPDVAAAVDRDEITGITWKVIMSSDPIQNFGIPVAIQLNIGQGPFAAPFGTATVAFTPTALLPQSEKDRYNSLPTREQKDAFVRNTFFRLPRTTNHRKTTPIIRMR